MNPTYTSTGISRLVALVFCAIALALPLAVAQLAPTASTAPSAASLARYDRNKNGALDADELAAMRADEARATAAAKAAAVAVASESADSEVVQLPPFEVTGAQDRGYLAASAMSGTRLNS
jgi:hypothetical protein